MDATHAKERTEELYRRVTGGKLDHQLFDGLYDTAENCDSEDWRDCWVSAALAAETAQQSAQNLQAASQHLIFSSDCTCTSAAKSTGCTGSLMEGHLDGLLGTHDFTCTKDTNLDITTESLPSSVSKVADCVHWTVTSGLCVPSITPKARSTITDHKQPPSAASLTARTRKRNAATQLPTFPTDRAQGGWVCIAAAKSSKPRKKVQKTRQKTPQKKPPKKPHKNCVGICIPNNSATYRQTLRLALAGQDFHMPAQKGEKEVTVECLKLLWGEHLTEEAIDTYMGTRDKVCEVFQAVLSSYTQGREQLSRTEVCELFSKERTKEGCFCNTQPSPAFAELVRRHNLQLLLRGGVERCRARIKAFISEGK